MTDTPIPKDEVLRGDYTHTMRDGTPATFPAGTKRSEMVDAISKYEGISPTDSAVAGFSRGTALGFGDEARAAIHAQFPEISKWMMAPPFDGKLTAGPVKNIITEGGPGMQGGETLYTPSQPQAPPPVSDAPTFDRRYDENLATARGEEKLHETLNPKASMAGQIAGNVATSALMPGSWMSAQSLLPWMLKSGIGNAVLGGVQGYGEGEGDSRLASAGWGAAGGGAAGALAPPVGALGKFMWKGVPTAMRAAGDWLEASAPRVATESASAAAVTPTIVQDSLRADMAHWLRSSSDSMVNKATAARIADDLAASRITPEQAQAQLDRLGDASNIANVSPNVARSARDSYILPGEGREVIDANLDAQRRRLGGDMRAAIGADDAPRMADARADFRAHQAAVGERVYGEALDQTPLRVNPALQELADIPAVRAARQAAVADFTEHGIQPTEARLAHETKRYLNLIAEGRLKTGTPIDTAKVANTAQRYEQALWDANPHIRDADLRYAQAGGMERRLDEGQRYATTGRGEKVEGFDPSSLARDIPDMTIGENTALRWGAQNDLRAQTASEEKTRALVRMLHGSDPVEGITARLEQIMPDRMAPLRAEANAQRIYGNTDRQIRGGATERAGDIKAGLTDMGGGGIPTDSRGITRATVDWLIDKAARARSPTQLMRDEYARMATTGDKAQQAETLALIRRLLDERYAPPVAPGAPAAGLTIDMTRRPNQ